MEQVNLTPGFVSVADVLRMLPRDGFARLRDWAARDGRCVIWEPEQLDALAIAPEDIVDALGHPMAESPSTVFDAFTGSWLGGDPHDTTRSYEHVWMPTQREDDQHVQRVLMRPLAGGAPTVAFNLCGQDGQIRGVVGGRPYVGFMLRRDALLWIGAEGPDAVSVHAERVIASGQLYEVRGWVVSLAAGRPEHLSRSDWRYHRVVDGAVVSI